MILESKYLFVYIGLIPSRSNPLSISRDILQCLPNLSEYLLTFYCTTIIFSCDFIITSSSALFQVLCCIPYIITAITR